MSNVTDDIVLVDDDPMVAEFVRRVLRRGSWQLRAFDDPTTALTHLSTHTPSVLIVDTRMPAMDGPELLVRLAARDRSGGRHVFLCSAGPAVETEWTRQLSRHVESVPKDELLDRHTLRARLERIAGPRAGSDAA